MYPITKEPKGCPTKAKDNDTTTYAIYPCIVPKPIMSSYITI